MFLMLPPVEIYGLYEKQTNARRVIKHSICTVNLSVFRSDDLFCFLTLDDFISSRENIEMQERKKRERKVEIFTIILHPLPPISAMCLCLIWPKPKSAPDSILRAFTKIWSYGQWFFTSNSVIINFSLRPINFYLVLGFFFSRLSLQRSDSSIKIKMGLLQSTMNSSSVWFSV